MSVPIDDAVSSSHSQIPSIVFSDLLDSIIVDIASECHRIARLGLDHNLEEEEEELRLSAEARAEGSDPSNSGEANGKYVVDIFGQTHPTIATEVFECMNCGRTITAGRFAPHLEKCMGKGRKARRKVTRSGMPEDSQKKEREKEKKKKESAKKHSNLYIQASQLACLLLWNGC